MFEAFVYGFIAALLTFIAVIVIQALPPKK